MSEILYINKKRVDFGKSKVTRRLQIGDVGDISKRKSSFSYTVKLPKTSRNKQIFELLGYIGNTSRKPFERLVIDYVSGGVPLVSNGYGKINETSDYYSLNIYDGIIDLGDKLKGKKISELPFVDIDHLLTTQTYIDSFSNIEGYIYAIANFGLGTASDIKVETQAPSIYTHTIFRKIFESVGLNLVGDFFSVNQKYLSEVITPVKGYTIDDAASTSVSKGNASLTELTKYETSESYISFEEQFSLSNNGLVGASIVGDKMVFSVAGVYKITMSMIYSTYDTFLSYKLTKNGSTISIISLTGQQDSGSGTDTKDLTFSVEVNDEIEFFAYGNSGFKEGEEEEFYTVNFSLLGTANVYLQTGGQLIQAVDFIGDVNQIDFVNDVIRRYGLILHPIQNSSDYRFKQLETVLNDRATAEDWTDKVKIIGKEKYKSGYAQTNKAVYNYPEEIVIPNNDGEMIIDNENAAIEKTMFSSIFEIPNEAGTYKTELIYSVPIWELVDAVIENRETNIKTMRITRYDVSITAKLFTELTGISATTDIPFLSLENMSMQFYLSNYYKAFGSLIENYKEKEPSLNLTTIDVVNLNFFRLKYLKQTGRFYYLNRVQHTVDKLSKVKLIEIFEFLQNEPPSQVGDFSFDMPHDATRTITEANLLTDYLDPEQDTALKVKILSGWNSDLIMKQDGVVISSETEILLEDLALTVFDDLGGLGAYSKSWTFTIQDAGSGSYSSEIGTITANVIELINVAPVADAGIDQSKELIPPEPTNVFMYVNGSASYDDTGEIVSYFWSFDSKPAASSATISKDTSTPTETLTIPNESDSVGTYVLRLKVTDEYGLFNEDTMTIIITESELGEPI